MTHISAPQFASRFPALVLGGQGWPKKQQDRQILLISAILDLDPARVYAEDELNDQLRLWTERFGASCGLDHVTLRRYLIDDGYIQRDPAGRSYQKAAFDSFTYDASIASLDLDVLVDMAWQEREERKRRYLQASNSS